MLTDYEIDKLVKECHIKPHILKLVARGIKSDVVCMTYLSKDELKKILLTQTVEGNDYKHIAIQIYSEGYENFKERIKYEFSTLGSVFKDIIDQFPATKHVKTKKEHRFRVNNVWKVQMERNIDFSRIEEMMENTDQEKQKETYNNILEEKKLKEKFFGDNENYSKEVIAYKIKDTLMNNKDKHGPVCFRRLDEESDDKLLNKSEDVEEKIDDDKWLEYQRKKFFKSDQTFKEVKKSTTKLDPYLNEFRSILTNSNLIRDIETCMKNSFASSAKETQKLLIKRESSPLRCDPNIRTFLVKTQNKLEKEANDGVAVNPYDRLCQPTKSMGIRKSELAKDYGYRKVERDNVKNKMMTNKEPKRLLMKSSHSLWAGTEDARNTVTTNAEKTDTAEKIRHSKVYNINSARYGDNRIKMQHNKFDFYNTKNNFNSTNDTMERTGKSFYSQRNNTKSASGQLKYKSRAPVNSIFQKTQDNIYSKIRLKTNQINKISHEYPTLNMQIIDDYGGKNDRSQSPEFNPNVYMKNDRKIQSSFLVKFNGANKKIPKDK